MTRSVSTDFKEAAFAQETGEVFVLLLDISHADWADTLRITSDYNGTTSGGNEYTYYPVDIELPSDEEANIAMGKLRVDNVSPVIAATFRALSSPPSVTIKAVLASDPDTIEVEYTGFQLVNITYDLYVVEASIVIEDFYSEPFPGDCFLPSTFPGIF